MADSAHNRRCSHEIGLHFGALSDPLKKQLAEQGLRLPTDACRFYQSSADAIVSAHIHGFLTMAERRKALGRLFDKLLVDKRLKEVRRG